MHIKIGTRGSKLAMWQALYIQTKLVAKGLSTEIIIIETKGDKILDRALSKIGSKGVFTEELEEQLHNGLIDIAVHSAKDLQSDIGENLKIIAFTEREKTNDVLISNQDKSILNSKKSIIIGTSSTRRIAMLKANMPQHTIVDMRGNLQTRIKKMDSGNCDALMLAYAGVHRMNYNDMIFNELDNSIFVPPVGQGTIAIEVSVRLDVEKSAKIREICNHSETERCLLTERAFLKELKGGCSIPVFGYAKLQNQKIVFDAGLISLNGKKSIRKNYTQQDETPEQVGILTADAILSDGGQEILNEIKAMLN